MADLNFQGDLMFINTPTFKLADLQQSAFALSVGGSATASNVAVQSL